MPRIHPQLGVPCMTVSEFWKLEAEKENRDAADLISDFQAEIAADEERSKAAIENDKDSALERLKEYYSPLYCDSTFQPTKVVDIRDVYVSYGYSKSTTAFTATVECDDGVTRNLRYSESEYSGSYMEPPDFDCECKEITG